MEYSKIKSIQLENFMGYRQGVVQFDEKGILNFKGYNSSGKSAFLTGVAVALMNMYLQKQTKYIYHDQTYFRIIVTFDDGISIVRDKYKNGQSLYEMYRDEECIFTTRAGNKLTKVEGVPETIKNYLGLINTQLGYLNYQVRRDPLWLIDTTGSENYYTLNEVLKSEEIARANALLNSDKNQLQSELTQIESEVSSIEMQLDGMTSLNEEILLRLSEKEVEVQNLLNQYDLIYSIGSILEELSAVRELPEVSLVEVSQLVCITELKSRLEEISSISYFPEPLEEVDSLKLTVISGIQSFLNAVEEAEKTLFGASVSSIDISGWSELSAIVKLAREYNSALTEYTKLKGEAISLVKERDSLIRQADAEGMKFVVCENCGTMMEVEKG